MQDKRRTNLQNRLKRIEERAAVLDLIRLFEAMTPDDRAKFRAIIFEEYENVDATPRRALNNA